MKKLFFTAMLAVCGLVSAQSDAFEGKGDVRLNVGANFQNGGTGIQSSLDYGLGESFSAGVQAGYLLGVKEYSGEKPSATHRFDVKARVSAHLGDVLRLPSNVDVYPGLNLGLKNFGAHVGARMFFDKGFGVFAEAQFPMARYNTEASSYRLLNNQFAFVVGASFDLTK
ncbi:DUF6646 family protein [Bergeyella sp. RCAD1439]|uniref:DUF6646 family protein n=1 Tax=Bergeyella anatis TaxID=3113737 RepID=UPI002E1998B3|nr:DUF6646 family protein [Bergeyella sp. RCAD1439]